MVKIKSVGTRFRLIFYMENFLKKLHFPIDLKLALGSMIGNVKRKNEKGSARNDVY